MTVMLDDEVADLRRANAELQQRLDEALAERDEVQAQKTAMSEVMEVINSSPGDLALVFDTMLEKALNLCKAAFGCLFTYNGEAFHSAAQRGMSAALVDYLREPIRPRTSGYSQTHGALQQLIRGESVVHHADLKDSEAYRNGLRFIRALVDFDDGRTALWVALRKDDKLLGVFVIYRREVRPFSDKQIALLQNFAAQAVIAMENARLINETREALEQQTATTEVLQVINRSPGDLAPVFQTILERAHALCETSFGGLMMYDGERFQSVAFQGIPARFREILGAGIRPEPGDPFGRMVEGAPLSHIRDLSETATQYPDHPLPRAAVDLAGIRTFLVVPLRKDNALLGVITAYRQEVHPFTEKQIGLLQNFAAQAVIAMENARLITETREALEQQTATAEVLQVINSSPGNLAPVFDAMLDKVMYLCDAAFGLLLLAEADTARTVASRNVPEAFVKFLTREPLRFDSDTFLARAVQAGFVIHVSDAATEDPYKKRAPLAVAAVELGGIRTMLMVPMKKDGESIGLFTIYRQEVRSFTDKQIALLENFAAQAVIAMENARLLDEIRQRQAELRVTFDNMGDGVAMFDESLRLAAWNRNFQELLELPKTVLDERPTYEEYIRILANRGEFSTEDIEAELTLRLEEIEQELRLERTRPDGRVIEVRRNSVPDGGFVFIYSDITDRKRSEAEIRAARDAAEAAYRDLKAAQANLVQAEKMASLGQLTAGIAHEIKNPLNFVNNFANLSVELLDELRETAAPALTCLENEQRAEVDEVIEMLTGNLEKIAEHGRRADGIVTSMLEHSRGSSGERRSVNLNHLVEDALNLAYHGARAQDQSFNVTLEHDFDPAIPPIELVPQDITRVCLNLISNGFYASRKREKEEGNSDFEPSLKLSTRNIDEAVEIRIRDNGIGILPEIRDKLFQPFFTTKPTGEGTGLGLSISYDIVTQQHGGTITVDSRVGEFTEFTIRLPRNRQTSAIQATASV